MSLGDYIKSCERKRFQYGAFDCLTFADGGYHAAFGRHFATDWLGGYDNETGAARKFLRLSRGGFHDNIIDAMDARLTRVHTLSPQAGSVVFRECDTAIGGIFGVSLPYAVAFLTMEGVIKVPHLATDLFWL